MPDLLAICLFTRNPIECENAFTGTLAQLTTIEFLFPRSGLSMDKSIEFWYFQF